MLHRPIKGDSFVTSLTPRNEVVCQRWFGPLAILGNDDNKPSNLESRENAAGAVPFHDRCQQDPMTIVNMIASATRTVTA